MCVGHDCRSAFSRTGFALQEILKDEHQFITVVETRSQAVHLGFAESLEQYRSTQAGPEQCSDDSLTTIKIDAAGSEGIAFLLVVLHCLICIVIFQTAYIFLNFYTPSPRWSLPCGHSFFIPIAVSEHSKKKHTYKM